jgi:4-hydroxythreonine-4-phosphate dehydrogenase
MHRLIASVLDKSQSRAAPVSRSRKQGDPQMQPTRIGLVLGDPAGVGPELIAKLLARTGEAAASRFVAIGTEAALTEGAKVAEVALPEVPLIAIPADDLGPIQAGEATRQAGAFALRSLQAAVDAVRAGRISAIVYAPLNKHAMKLAGFAEVDEMHYLARLFGCTGFFTELNQLDEVWTTRVTSHVPLRDVAALITEQRVMDAAGLAIEAMRRAGIARPRVAVAGLNPHAGDGGTIGSEDIEIIAPAVARLRAQGHDIHGPASPDTVFLGVRRGTLDLVVTMYHDQGQIALKSLGFERVVTILGGLPVPAITASSGSAYDIAGRNAGNPEALIRACALAERLATAAPTNA